MTVQGKVTVEGLKKALSQIQNVKKTLGDGVHSGLKECAKHLLVKSKEIVPADLNHLKQSGHWGFKGQGLHTESRVYYTADYAVIVHEDPRNETKEITHGQDYNIKHATDIAQKRKYWYKGRLRTYHSRRPPEQWKYLEKPARENLTEFQDILLEEINRRISK